VGRLDPEGGDEPVRFRLLKAGGGNILFHFSVWLLC
jgi:hypothetical protein